MNYNKKKHQFELSEVASLHHYFNNSEEMGPVKAATPHTARNVTCHTGQREIANVLAEQTGVPVSGDESPTGHHQPSNRCQMQNHSSYNYTVKSSPSSGSDRNFGVLVRHWRSIRRVSQLELSLEAEISTRHLSCVETGRAQPSREMVLRLAEALRVPLRERNALLLAAGYAPQYRHTAIDAPELEAARRAVEFLVAQLEPNPVLVLDRYWNILRMNDGAKRILALFPGCDSVTPLNGPRLVFHPQGLRPFIENWEVMAARII